MKRAQKKKARLKHEAYFQNCQNARRNSSGWKNKARSARMIGSSLLVLGSLLMIPGYLKTFGVFTVATVIWNSILGWLFLIGVLAVVTACAYLAFGGQTSILDVTGLARLKNIVQAGGGTDGERKRQAG